MVTDTNGSLIEVRDLKTYFRVGTEPVRAVDGVNFTIRRGETVALVGESGCGKSMTALSLARLVPQPPGYFAGGEILYRGKDVLRMSESDLLELRGNEISYVFQEPSTSLNPVFRVGAQIGEAIHIHRKGVNVGDEVVRMLGLVGISDPERRQHAYPHELSGGMQQRVMIAMALACHPELLIADEPTTALDVTIQAQILDLLGDLQKELGMAILLITHNLGLVADVAHTVNVMYAGRIVEAGPTEDVLGNPRHPYTQALLNAVPQLEGATGRLRGIDGSVPNPARLPEGCKFHPRCTRCEAVCQGEEPKWEVAEAHHGVRCHFWQDHHKKQVLNGE